MRTLTCKTHRVDMVETEELGRIRREFRTTVTDPRRGGVSATGCALFHMAQPGELARGDRYVSGPTGRLTYSTCEIEEA